MGFFFAPAAVGSWVSAPEKVTGGQFCAERSSRFCTAQIILLNLQVFTSEDRRSLALAARKSNQITVSRQIQGDNEGS